jgi:hypothetical protein
VLRQELAAQTAHKTVDSILGTAVFYAVLMVKTGAGILNFFVAGMGAQNSAVSAIIPWS